MLACSSLMTSTPNYEIKLLSFIPVDTRRELWMLKQRRVSTGI